MPAMIAISLSRLQIIGVILGCATALCTAAEPPAKPAAAPAEKAGGEKALFDGKTLTGWKTTPFAGTGEITVKDGKMILDPGEPLTGVNYTGETPKMNYEISLETMRLQGSDFFCGLTFPVGDACVTFILGGWGGGVIGISSINAEDASENETTQYKKLDSDHWYRVKIRVTPAKLEAWVDDEQMVNLEIENKKLGMRAGEIELSQPFGIAAFRTRSALRGIKIRTIEPAAKKP
jgi:hypothetical protein